MLFGGTILQRYILSEILKVFTLVLLCLTVLVVFAGVMQQAIEKGLTMRHTLQILPFILPSMLPFTIPAALLLTVSLVYGRLASDHEITAAKAAGINVLSLLRPALALGLVFSVGCFFLTDRIIPWAEDKIEQSIVQAMEEIFLERLRTDLMFDDEAHGLSISVTGVEGHTLENATIRLREGRGVKTLFARRAAIRLDLEKQVIVVRLKDAYIDLPDESRNQIRLAHYEERIRWRGEAPKPRARNYPIHAIQLEMERSQSQQREFEDRRRIGAIMALTSARFEDLGDETLWRTRELRGAEGWYHKLRTEMHSRTALAASCLFFILVGGPYAILKAKGQLLTSFMYTFGPIVVAYYPMMLGLMTQSKEGHLDPTWAMWVGNAAMFVWGLAALRQVLKH